jgi:hypothetical protein
MREFRYQRTAPLLPEAADLASPAQRMNRFGVAVAVLAGLGVIALAVLVSPIAAPSATMASYSAVGASSAATASSAAKKDSSSEPSTWTASHAVESASAVSETQGKGDLQEKPAPVAGASQFEVVLAALPHRAAKSDYLPRRAQASPPQAEPQPAVIDSWRDADLLSRLDGGDAADSDAVSPPEMADSESQTASNSDAEPVVKPKAKPNKTTRSAPVRADVNMRARPDNNAAVIMVVPAKSEVGLISCRYWCEVTFRGKRGWIYKGFVRGV